MASKMRFFIVNFFAKIPYAFARLSKFIQLNCKVTSRMWRWLAIGAATAIGVFLLAFAISFHGALSAVWLLISVLLIASLPLLYGALFKIIQLFFRVIPKKYFWIIVAAGAMIVMHSMASFWGLVLQMIFYLFTFLFLFGAISNMSAGAWKELNKIKRSLNLFFLFIGSAGLVVMTWFLIYPGPDEKPDEAKQNLSFFREQLDVADPSAGGPFAYTSFTYGNGNDKHRDEYAANCTYISKTVDGSSFLEAWEKLPGKLRTFYWGFSSDSLPLNARGWMPQGEGAFPIILMVHGNHFDRDFSDGGYAYLGELFASHGVMALSVDENFLNGSITDFFKSFSNENDARGWLLLKHLELLRSWNANPDSDFYQRIDLDNIILIGHSRGGEAACIAAAFNTIPCYPDNAEELFDFNFGIKGVASIAQVDGQYKPSGYSTKLKDLNFLSLQGSMDADLKSYMGLRQYNRLTYSDSSNCFKAGVFIPGANHGQFNTTWGKYDIGFPNKLFLNRKSMMEAEDQRKIAKVYLNAFQKVVFGSDPRYLPFFEDYRFGSFWLPEVAYENQYQHAKTKIIADFEDDIDLYSGKTEGITIHFENLARLDEQNVGLRNGTIHSKAVFIGWNNESDCIPGYFQLQCDPPICINEDASLVFDLSVSEESPGERWGSKKDEEEKETTVESDPDSIEEDETALPVSFEICLFSTNGDSAKISLKDYYSVYPIGIPQMYKLKVLADPLSPELTPQYISIPFSTFEQFVPDSLKAVRFIFSEGEKGVVCIDNIGILP